MRNVFLKRPSFGEFGYFSSRRGLFVLDRPMSKGNKPIHIFISGASGRMGKALIRLMEESPDFRLAGGLVRSAASVPHGRNKNISSEGGIAPLGPDMASRVSSADILLDFSRPEMTKKAVALAVKHDKPLLIGTTGLDASLLSTMRKAAKRIPVLFAPNTSLGIALLAQSIQNIAARLGPGWDVEILEMHHRHKRDAPSGTALFLGEAIARGRNINLGSKARYDRTQNAGERETGTIGFASLRGGDVAGEHIIIFAREGERLEFIHRISNRDVFAQGALDMIHWLIEQRPGFYNIEDYLGSLAPKKRKSGNP